MIAATGILGALAAVLMFLSFGIPIVPSFLKMDFAEVPALLAGFAYGPVSGIFVCLIKNVLNLPFSTTSGIGEFSNFLLSAVFVTTSSLIYKYGGKNRKNALVGSLIGAFTMSIVCIFTNYFIVYPMFSLIGFSREAVLSMYQAILPSVKDLWQALAMFNFPFTFAKGLVNVLITFLVYKKLSPLLHGKR